MNKIWYNGDQYEIGQRCFVCPLRKFSTTAGATYCNDCPAGFSCANPGSNPVICPRGYASSNTSYMPYYSYSNYVGDSCIRCPSGTYTMTNGSSECLPCPPDMFCPDPSMDPIPIPTGIKMLKTNQLKIKLLLIIFIN